MQNTLAAPTKISIALKSVAAFEPDICTLAPKRAKRDTIANVEMQMKAPCLGTALEITIFTNTFLKWFDVLVFTKNTHRSFPLSSNEVE